MVKREIEEAIAEGEWSRAVGLGLLGVVSSIGIGTALIILFVAAGVCLFLAVLFMPLVLAGIVTVFTYFLAGLSGLRDARRFLAAAVAGIGSLILFQFVDVTILCMSMAGVEAQARGMEVGGLSLGIGEALTNMVRLFQLLIGGLILLFILIGIWSLRALGGEPGALIGGAIALIMVGVAINDLFNLSIPGLAQDVVTGGMPLMFLGMAASFLIGSVVQYLATRLAMER